jgi:adenylate cyclase
MSLDDFSEVAFHSGHITLFSDSDGVYRHMPMLVKIDSLYFPALALSVFLNYAQVPFADIMVDWGHKIIIPAKPDSFLDHDIIIPIDTHGRTFIPYIQAFGQDFQQMTAHDLLKYHAEEHLQGNLTEFFEGKFVIVTDISAGLDLGHIPLAENTLKVTSHAALLNGLLQNTFYRKWSFWQTMGLICALSMILGISALPRSSWFLYLTGLIVFIGIMGLTWQQFIRFSLFPIVTVGGSVLFIFFGLVVGLQMAISKDQAFIRSAFSKYVPEAVVNELLVHPERLKLGGESVSCPCYFLTWRDSRRSPKICLLPNW